MRKSIELGRAVLSTSTSLELWLKTLITISLQQECTNLEQRDEASLIDQLSSGEAWVGRGNGLHIDLEITRNGQPLAHEQLRRLAEAILAAPAWKQLNLQPSLPFDDNYEPGRLRITVNHSSECAVSNTKLRHRMVSDISAVDLRPPDGVPAICLDSVHLSMDVFDNFRHQETARAKRVKTSAGSDGGRRPARSQMVERPDQEGPDELLHQYGCTPPKPMASLPVKRRRAPGSPPWKMRLLPLMPPEIPNDYRMVAKLGGETEIAESKMIVDITDLHTLVDGAIRLSLVSNLNTKMTPGIKVKANTFGAGLADIAPILWRPGYSLSVAQRANLIPMISRSLGSPAATGKTASISLRRKLSALRKPMLSFQTTDQPQTLGPANTPDARLAHTYSAPWLWTHLQKNLVTKSAMPVQSFVIAEACPPDSKPEEMLEGSWQEGERAQGSRPCAVGSDGSGASSVDRILQEHPVTPMDCEDSFSEKCCLGIAATPDHNLAVADHDLLLGEERFEPLSSVTVRGNSITNP